MIATEFYPEKYLLKGQKTSENCFSITPQYSVRLGSVPHFDSIAYPVRKGVLKKQMPFNKVIVLVRELLSAEITQWSKLFRIEGLARAAIRNNKKLYSRPKIYVRNAFFLRKT